MNSNQGISNKNLLLGLPPNILGNVTSYLTMKDHGQLQRTSQGCRSLANSHYYWAGFSEEERAKAILNVSFQQLEVIRQVKLRPLESWAPEYHALANSFSSIVQSTAFVPQTRAYEPPPSTGFFGESIKRIGIFIIKLLSLLFPFISQWPSISKWIRPPSPPLAPPSPSPSLDKSMQVLGTFTPRIREKVLYLQLDCRVMKKMPFKELKVLISQFPNLLALVVYNIEKSDNSKISSLCNRIVNLKLIGDLRLDTLDAFLLHHPNLTQLNLGKTTLLFPPGNNNILCLKSPNLRYLTLPKMYLYLQNVKTLANGVPNLLSLDITQSQITGAICDVLTRGLQKLEELKLWTTIDGIPTVFANCKNLKKLVLTNLVSDQPTPFSRPDETCKLEELQIVRSGDCYYICFLFPYLHNLKNLVIKNRIYETKLVDISKACPNLQKLTYGSELSKDDLYALNQNCPHLQSLTVRASAQTVGNFKDFFPHKKITIHLVDEKEWAQV